MIDIPIQTVGFGFPDNLVPNWDCWELCADRASNQSSSALDRPDDFNGEYLYIGMNASMKQQIAAALPKLGTVKYLVLDAYVIPQQVVDSLQEMPQLERLYLAPTRTKSLEFLDQLDRLSYLAVEAAPNVRDLGPILRREKLVSLGLGTSVDSLETVREGVLPNLRCLVLEGTGETKPARFPTLLPLQNLQNLEYLCPLNCRVEDKSLGFALHLPKLKAIHLYSTRWWNTDDISTLVEQGVSVTRIV